MICKICNATIDDNAAACPFCGSPVTMNVDPNNTPAFPDPAGSTPVQNPVPTPDPVNATPDLGLSEPAQPYSDPMASQNSAPQNSTDPYAQSPYTQNPNTYSQPNSYGAPNTGYSAPNTGYSAPNTGYSYSDTGASQELEKKAGSVQTLGIVGLVLAIVIGFCCCTLPGPICGIVGLVKANSLKGDMYLLSEDGQKKVNLGKILCIIAIALGVLATIVNIVLMSSGTYSDFLESLD